MGGNGLITYTKKKKTRIQTLEPLMAGYPYKKQNLLITICGNKGKEEDTTILFFLKQIAKFYMKIIPPFCLENA